MQTSANEERLAEPGRPPMSGTGGGGGGGQDQPAPPLPDSHANAKELPSPSPISTLSDTFYVALVSMISRIVSEPDKSAKTQTRQAQFVAAAKLRAQKVGKKGSKAQAQAMLRAGRAKGTFPRHSLLTVDGAPGVEAAVGVL